MKKVLLSLTLFMASFFFITLNEVCASTYSYDLSEESFNMLNDTFFSFREKVIEYVKENNIEKYFIFYNSSQKYYRAMITSDNSGFWIKPQTVGSERVLRLSYSNAKQLYLNSSGNITISSSSSGQHVLISSDINLDYYLDSNFDLKSYNYIDNVEYINSDIYSISYKDLSYTISKDSASPTLYQIYQDYNKEDVPDVSDNFIIEKEILNNFYTTIFTKISNLANNFANNYTFLLILGIFILIFVFELIRRRFI